jgi:tRNA pseudouridine55 synthase
MRQPLPNLNPFIPIEGILLVDKSKGPTSFSLVQALRRRLGVKKIGHAGTLDPFATGVMVMLIGRPYTRLSDIFLCNDKEYVAEVYLGITTDTYDSEGKMIAQSAYIPSLEEIDEVLNYFQGEIAQIPPMYSAKKKQGQKLYELARKGQEVPRDPVTIALQTQLIRYEYPYLELHISCSKGTYIRSVAYDLGMKLGCGAHLTNLRRIRSGQFKIEDCINEAELYTSSFNLQDKLKTL